MLLLTSIFQKKITRYIFAAIACLLICLSSRNSILRFAFKRVQVRVYEIYQLKLSYSSVRFSGFDGIEIKDITLQPIGADTLAHLKEIALNLALLDLITGKIGFDKVKLQDALVTVYNRTERNNLRFLQPVVRQKSVSGKTSETSYRKLAMNLKSKLIRSFNTAFELENIQVRYEDSTNAENIFVPEMKYDLKNLSGLVINQIVKDTLIVSGRVLEKNKQYEFTVQHENNAGVYLPFLNRERSLKCTFKSLTASLGFESRTGELQIAVGIQAENFHINHWRLANDDVVFERAEFKGKLNVKDNNIELDSSSTVKLKDVQTRLFASYQIRPDTVFTFSIRMPETVSDTFFHALPKGMFNTLKGISCTGSLEYDLFFKINTRQPDSLVFHSSLKKKNFSIRHYGTENYERMNASFTYEAFDKDRFVRNVEVSSVNPMFTPLNHISDYLVKSVLQSEDPSFMLHRGFLPESFRESIIKNYRERRFARGGSTISMQLVKNVFLNRDKTVSRKAEEALIVYLIENLRLVPKERMLEVYLNVIEWGPNVYGIGEASRFYFDKTPGELNLQESIFLAGIIPQPKYFKYQFDKEGKLKPYLSGYFRILTGRMASKGWISSVDTSGLLPDVKLKGPALQLVVPTDTIIPQEEEELLME